MTSDDRPPGTTSEADAPPLRPAGGEGPASDPAPRRTAWRRGGKALQIVVGVIAGFALARANLPLEWPALLLTAVLVVVLPLLSLAQRGELDTHIREIPRPTVYLSSAIALWVIAGVTLVAAVASGFTLRTLGLTALPPLELVAWTAGLSLLGTLPALMSRALGVRETFAVQWLLPRTRREKIGFAGLSLTAGITEEIVFRAFLIPVLVVLLGSSAAAVVVSSAAFGLLHAYQGPIGMVRTGLIGAALALPLVLSGSIVPSILAHAAVNLVVGVVLVDWFRTAD
jgi:uncharacterized protein